MYRLSSPVFAAIALASCTVQDAAPIATPPTPAIDSQVIPYDKAGLERLLQNKGITLQWIGWNDRGSVLSRMDDGVLYLTGVQDSSTGPGKLLVDGNVIEIGSDYFILDGTIRITDAPDIGRACEKKKLWHFAITQNRKYYRLREFEWCDV